MLIHLDRASMLAISARPKRGHKDSANQPFPSDALCLPTLVFSVSITPMVGGHNACTICSR